MKSKETQPLSSSNTNVNTNTNNVNVNVKVEPKRRQSAKSKTGKKWVKKAILGAIITSVIAVAGYYFKQLKNGNPHPGKIMQSTSQPVEGTKLK